MRRLARRETAQTRARLRVPQLNLPIKARRQEPRAVVVERRV